MNAQMNKIIAQNTSLSLPENAQLALIATDGEILIRGKELITVVFNAMKKQAVNEVFANVIPLNK
jgi:hypothetical protein